MSVKQPVRLFYADTGEEITGNVPLDGREVIVKDAFTGKEIRRFKATIEELLKVAKSKD